MAPLRDASGTVRRVLRRRFADGLVAPGRILSVVELADEFSVSTTPVREALARLVGEGLVDDARGPGFVAGPPDPSTVAGLYRLRGVLMEAAARRIQARLVVQDDLQALLCGVMTQSADQVLEQEFARVQLRLGSARRAEGALFDASACLDALRAAAAAGRANFAAAIAAYHRERVAAAVGIWRTMTSPDKYVQL